MTYRISEIYKITTELDFISFGINEDGEEEGVLNGIKINVMPV